jgi:hypothetical protein
MMSGSVKVEEGGEWRADARGEDQRIEDFGEFHDVSSFG